MRAIITFTVLATLLAASPSLSDDGARFNGTLKLGTVIFDEEAADLSAMQETYNIYEGFSVSQFLLNGTLNPRNTFTINLRQINRDGRNAHVVYRMPGTLRLTGRYDQHRQVFDSERMVNSRRKDLFFTARVTPARSWRFSADYGYLTRDGERVTYPAGTQSALGTQYDYIQQTVRAEGEFHKDRYGVAVGYDFSDYADELSTLTDRTGNVVSARLFGPCYFFPDKFTHMLRGSYGTYETTSSGIDYTLSTFQYLGIVTPFTPVQLKYKFYLSRVDNTGTGFLTDNMRNDVDLVYFHPHGRVFGGYGYETNDDDVSLTTSQVYRVGASYRHKKALKAQVAYSTRDKDDIENQTLLQDIETTRLTASVELKAPEDLLPGVLSVGARYADRTREHQDIGVEVEGRRTSVFSRYDYSGWGGLVADYSNSDDEYDDRVARFEAKSNVVTGRVEFLRLPNTFLAAGATYLEVRGDLDIDKSILNFEGRYTFQEDYFLEVKYNVYNYDDYLLLDRYYTANVVWINAGYNFRADISVE